MKRKAISAKALFVTIILAAVLSLMALPLMDDATASGSVSQSITYHPNGGSGKIIAVSVSSNSSYTVVDQGYTKNGYFFTGWNTRADGRGTAYSTGQTFNVNGKLVLYAQWGRI